MRNILGIGTALVALAGCVAPVASQTQAYDAPSDAASCRDIAGQAEIDGVMQRIVGRACPQPDGSWRIVQDSGAVVVVPAAGYPYYPYSYYPYYDPWYWGPPVGFGASFIFVDRFHHHHHMDHVRFEHPDHGMHGGGGGVRGPGGMHGMHGMGGMGGMSSGGMRHH
jgi:surface antigen